MFLCSATGVYRRLRHSPCAWHQLRSKKQRDHRLCSCRGCPVLDCLGRIEIKRKRRRRRRAVFSSDLSWFVDDSRWGLVVVRQEGVERNETRSTNSSTDSSLLGEKKLHLKPCGPVGRAIGIGCISEKLRVNVDRQFSEMHDLANSSADRHRPRIGGRCFPISSNDWRRRQIPPVTQVVVDEGLHQHLIYVGPRRWPRNREQVLHQCSK
jgi:hypothetical protein